MPNSPTKIYKILRKNFLSLLDIILVMQEAEDDFATEDDDDFLA